MRHTREEVILRTEQEFKRLDKLVANLADSEWAKPLPRPEGKDPWTVKDAVAHITHWKADVIRSLRRQRRPMEERGLAINDGNHLIYIRWRDRSPQEVLAWHRQVHKDVIAALKQMPEELFNEKEHAPEWPNDLDAHSAYHRVKDIEEALAKKS